jgi:hypothetical protein
MPRSPSKINKINEAKYELHSLTMTNTWYDRYTKRWRGEAVHYISLQEQASVRSVCYNWETTTHITRVNVPRSKHSIPSTRYPMDVHWILTGYLDIHWTSIGYRVLLGVRGGLVLQTSVPGTGLEARNTIRGG